MIDCEGPGIVDAPTEETGEHTGEVNRGDSTCVVVVEVGPHIVGAVDRGIGCAVLGSGITAPDWFWRCRRQDQRAGTRELGDGVKIAADPNVSRTRSEEH